MPLEKARTANLCSGNSRTSVPSWMQLRTVGSDSSAIPMQPIAVVRAQHAMDRQFLLLPLLVDVLPGGGLVLAAVGEAAKLRQVARMADALVHLHEGRAGHQHFVAAEKPLDHEARIVRLPG